MTLEIDERNLLGKNVQIKLTQEGAQRLNHPEDELLRIRVVETSADQQTLELIKIGGYDREYTNFDIYGDEIADIVPYNPGTGNKSVKQEDLERWRKD